MTISAKFSARMGTASVIAPGRWVLKVSIVYYLLHVAEQSNKPAKGLRVQVLSSSQIKSLPF